MTSTVSVSCVTALTVVCLLDFVTSAAVNRDQFLIYDNAGCRNRYGYKYYYDHGTEHCEQCREICQNAQIMRTTGQCRAECPQYLTAMKCADEEDEYYDDVLDACSPCSVLCDNHQVTGNSRDCREHCNAYLKKMTPKQVPSHHKQNYLKAVDGSGSEEDSQTSDLLVHPGWIAAMAVGGVALVCVVVVVIVLYWTCAQQQNQPYDPAPQQDGDGQVDEEQQRNRPRRPVEETSQGSSGSQHFAIDGASGTLPATVAFADLPTGRAHGERV